MDDDKLKQKVIALARDWLGTPYRHHASLKGVGTDCLGLLRGVYQELYGVAPEVPPYTPDWSETPNSQGEFKEPLLEAAQLYLAEMDKDKIQGGDVVLFKLFENSAIKHCAILTSTETMIHAYSNHEVCEVPLSSWWLRHITHAFYFKQTQEKT